MFEKRGGHPCQPSFGITISRRWITIDRAKIALTEHQGIAQAPGLRKTHQRVVHSKVPVGMVLAHHVSHDASALARGLVRLQPHLLHRVENAPVHRLQSVTDIGQRAADDYRHPAVEIRPPHLVFNVDGLHGAGARTTWSKPAITARRSQRQLWILIISHGCSLVPSTSLEAHGKSPRQTPANRRNAGSALAFTRVYFPSSESTV